MKMTVDLHGYSVAKAREVILKNILECRKSKQKKKLVIITGRGNHSPNNIPVIKPMFLQLMDDLGIPVFKHNEGCFQVSV